MNSFNDKWLNHIHYLMCMRCIILLLYYNIVSTILLVTALTKITHFIFLQTTRIHKTKKCLNFFLHAWLHILYLLQILRFCKNKYFPMHLHLLFSHSIILKIGNKHKFKPYYMTSILYLFLRNCQGIQRLFINLAQFNIILSY